MWDEYAKSPENALEWQQGYMNFMFDLEDASGKISHNFFICNHVLYRFRADYTIYDNSRIKTEVWILDWMLPWVITFTLFLGLA